ncbi:integrase [Cupriavidus necator]|uniref:Integrase n=1 Tax=Cupriavidus necator TaxID=106590 RepID=A0A367PPD7_CUPNE|nr:integrase [Cupriavidus necator]QQX84792.1 integrase [Cupriavidus necator]RCJ08865.1 integrase [Cupriavidus necator]
MAAVGRIGDRAGENWLESRERLIAAAKASSPFGDVEWDAAVWDVSVAYQHRTRGYKARALRLPFTQHRRRGWGVGDPIPAPFSDVIKALVCVRHQKRGQSAGSHSVFIRAARYVFEATRKAGHDVGELRKDDLDRAAAMVFRRERETSAYKVIGHMEELADALDRHRLCRVRLDWRCRRKSRPQSLTPDRIGDRPTEVSDRLPSEEAIRALGKLYQTIPKGESADDSTRADRILILIATIMVCTGLRIGEMLTLPVKPITISRDGSRNLRYARLKGRADDVAVLWHLKPLLSETVELVEAAVAELREVTAGARRVALLANRHGLLLRGKSIPEMLNGHDIRAVLGLKSRNIAQFLKSREIPFEIVNRGLLIGRDALCKGIAKDHWFGPLIPGPAGKGLELHESLCVVYANQIHRGTHTTLTYAARPVTDQNVHDFLTGRAGSRSVFDRYEFRGEDGLALRARSHGFRHFLNHLLDEGGAPDLVQTKWFGRHHAADTKSYQHLTSAQRAAQVVQDVLDGRVGGQIGEIAKALPREVARTFLTARIQAVHDVGPGLCIHDFQMSPCERHLQCTANCNDYVWIQADEAKAQELKRQAAVAYLSLHAVKVRARSQSLTQADWYRHLMTRYQQLMKQLATQGFHEADLVRYLKQEHRNAD